MKTYLTIYPDSNSDTGLWNTVEGTMDTYRAGFECNALLVTDTKKVAVFTTMCTHYKN